MLHHLVHPLVVEDVLHATAAGEWTTLLTPGNQVSADGMVSRLDIGNAQPARRMEQDGAIPYTSHIAMIRRSVDSGSGQRMQDHRDLEHTLVTQDDLQSSTRLLT